MMHWFAPVTEVPYTKTDMPRCETPVGESCERCHLPIADDDVGFLQFDQPRVVYHRLCFLKGVTPHKNWPERGLKPDIHDGFEPTGNGAEVQCPTCGMTYSFDLETWL